MFGHEKAIPFKIERSDRKEGGAHLTVTGKADFDSVEALRFAITTEIDSLAKGETVSIDMNSLQAHDSSVSALVVRLKHDLEDLGLLLEFTAMDPTTSALLDLVDREKVEHRPEKEHVPHNPFVYFGERTMHAIQDLKELVWFIGSVVNSMIWSLRHPLKIRWREVMHLIQETGADGLPIVALMSALVGMVTAFSSAIQLRQFGANIFIADLVGIGMTREMGPLMAAILLTGRSGSAFAAEIGTMKISDEVDALEVMRISPLHYLVMPRIFAVMLTLPLLTLFGDIFGIAGGIVVAVFSLDITPIGFLQQLEKAIGPWDVFSGMLKAFVFGILIAGVGCYRGIETRGGALAVGKSTTSSVVSGIFLVVLADSLFVIIFHYLGVG